MSTVIANTTTEKTGILLVNLGTPEAPTPKALRQYLSEFLTDRRVIELPPLLWRLLLYGLILRKRSKRSAALYEKIWLPEGSPLRVYSERLTQSLQTYLHLQNNTTPVILAMRYGEPSIVQGLQQLKKLGVDNIILLPLYPQYSATTTASVFDRIAQTLSQQRNLPGLTFIRDYHQHPAYIQALSLHIQQHWTEHGRGQHLIFSFHGIPQKYAVAGDPYPEQCQKTAQLIAQQLKLAPHTWSLAFQSRFGYAKWLQPYCNKLLKNLPKQGITDVDVICPGFAVDCLETLEEINQQYRDLFIQAGGTRFQYIPALNDSTRHVHALLNILEL